MGNATDVEDLCAEIAPAVLPSCVFPAHESFQLAQSFVCTSSRPVQWPFHSRPRFHPPPVPERLQAQELRTCPRFTDWTLLPSLFVWPCAWVHVPPLSCASVALFLYQRGPNCVRDKLQGGKYT